MVIVYPLNGFEIKRQGVYIGKQKGRNEMRNYWQKEIKRKRSL